MEKQKWDYGKEEEFYRVWRNKLELLIASIVFIEGLIHTQWSRGKN